MITTGMASLLAILENRVAEAAALMQVQTVDTDAEMLFYFARHYACIEKPNDAIRLVEQASRSGFICSPQPCAPIRGSRRSAPTLRFPTCSVTPKS